MSTRHGELESELYAIEDQIQALLDSDGFIEDLIELEQRRRALEGEFLEMRAFMPRRIAGSR